MRTEKTKKKKTTDNLRMPEPRVSKWSNSRNKTKKSWFG